MKLNGGNALIRRYVLLVGILIVVGSYIAICGIPILRQVGMSNIICIIMAITISAISMKISAKGRILFFLNGYSTEIYLIQFIWLKIAEKYFECFEYRLLFVIGTTIISAVIMEKMTKPVKKILKK